MVRAPLFAASDGDWIGPYHPRLVGIAAAVGLCAGMIAGVLARRADRSLSAGRPGPFARVAASPAATLPTIAAAVLGWTEQVLTPAEALGLAAFAVLVGTVVVVSPRPASREDGAVLLAAAAVVSFVGVWAGVPDTEGPILIGGTVAAGLVVATVVGRGRGRGGAFVGGAERVLIIAAVVAGAWSGARHHPALLGGVCCIGLVPLSPPAGARRWWPVMLAAHTAVVVVASRLVTGWTRGPAAAFPVAMLAVIVLAVAVDVRRDAPGSP